MEVCVCLSYIKLLESLDKLNTLVVSGPDKCLPSHVQFQLVQ